MSATAYFQTLFDLLKNVQVADRRGGCLSIENGTEQAIHMIKKVRTTSNKILLVGNGGSAAVASHIQNDLCHAGGLRAMAFHDIPTLTALSNDHGYPSAFERCVKLWSEPNDLLIAISSSGRSENILRAVRAHEAPVITCSGFLPDNPLRSMGDLNFYVESQVYGQVELAHNAILHYLSDRLMKHE